MHLDSQTRIRQALKSKRKIIFLFLITVVVPATALGVFGLRALEADRIEMERVLRREQESVNKEIQSSFESQIFRIHDQLTGVSESALKHDLDRARQIFLEDLQQEALYDSLVLLSSEGYRWWAAQNFSDRHNARSDLLSADGDPLQRAKRLEFGQRDLSGAIELYRQIADSAGGTLRLAALNSLGRSLAKAGEFADSAATYRFVLESWPDPLDSVQAPYLLIAGLRFYEISKIRGDEQHSIESLISNYRKLAEGQIRSPEIVDFYSSEYERALGEACLQNEDRCRSVADLRQELARNREQIGRESALLNRIAAMADSLQNLDESSRRVLEIPDSHEVVILGDRISGPSDEEFLLAITTLELGQVLEPALESIDLADAGIEVSVIDEEGETVFQKARGTTAGPETLSVLSSLLPDYQIRSRHRRNEAFWNPHYAARNFYIVLTVVLLAILLVGGFLTFRAVLQEAELIRVKGQFVSIVSHEFKSPITSMRTLVERLQDGLVPRPERRQQYLGVIGSELQRLTRLVNNLLDFTKIESGSKSYRKMSTDLPELLGDLLATFEPRATQLGFKLEKKISRDLPRVEVDRDGLSHAVLNLLDNAIKFSLDEKIVRVELERKKDEVAITVYDRGPGISPDEMDRIFEPSYRSSLSEEQHIPGLGIGLSIVQHVASSHGGRVEVSSSEAGSRFSLFLPVSCPSDADAKPGREEEEETFPKLVRGRRTGTER